MSILKLLCRPVLTCVAYPSPAVRLPFVTAGLLICSLLLACGCVSRERLSLGLQPDLVLPERAVLLFLVDGLDRNRFYELIEAGDLPHIERRFIRGGVQVQSAVTGLPSITYPNCTSTITGVFPGHHGIVGNFWFDRFELTARYYMTLGTYRTSNQHFAVPTLFEMLHDHFTLNIQAHTRRGVRHTIDNAQMFAWSWIMGWYMAADAHVADSIADAAAAANEVGRWPSIILTYYPGVDEIGHKYGALSPEYRAAVQNIDGVVARITSAIDEAGLGDATYYVLATDHAHAPVMPDRRIDLIEWLRTSRNLRIRTAPLDDPDYRKRHAVMSGYDAVASVDSGRVSMIHLRGQGGWSQRPAPTEVLAWIQSEPSVMDLDAVEVATFREGPDRVRLLSRGGAMSVERRVDAQGKQYRISNAQGDLLGLATAPELARFVETGWHDSRAWLATSAGTKYPDLVPQVVEMFDSPRTGDVVLLASEASAFELPWLGGHGSCLASDMRIPLMFAGPDLPAGASIEFARLVDVVPTVLGLLGEAKRLETIPPLDGIDLSGQLRSARPAAD